ncbi:hypothetical protein DFH09DRAFT_1442856 [Mycena vulgaris]|nr:hypothetical protein DFH09DRAFT_1442856 [Mycena vulgaris]
MTPCFDSSVLSSVTNTQDFHACASPQARKPRPIGLLIDHRPSIDTNAVSPDFDCRSISPVSTIVGFGRKRHSVLPTVPPEDIQISTTAGFGRKQYRIRHSILATTSASINPDRKRENRWSLPNPIIPKDPVDRPRDRRSLDLRSTHTPVLAACSGARRASVHALETARKVSDTLLGNTSRHRPKPLLLPRLVRARDSLPARVKQGLVAQAVAVASSPRVKFLFRRFSALRAMRLKPLKIGRWKTKEENGICTWEGLVALLAVLFYRLLHDIMGLRCEMVHRDYAASHPGYVRAFTKSLIMRIRGFTTRGASQWLLRPTVQANAFYDPTAQANEQNTTSDARHMDFRIGHPCA